MIGLGIKGLCSLSPWSFLLTLQSTSPKPFPKLFCILTFNNFETIEMKNLYIKYLENTCFGLDICTYIPECIYVHCIHPGSSFFVIKLIYFLIGYLFHLHFQCYAKSPPHASPSTPLPTQSHFLALAFPCTEAYKVCMTNGPLFPLMAD